jgi:hypothetical protein
VTGDPVQVSDFNLAEKVFLGEHMAPVETYADEGELKLRRHHLTTFETKLTHIEKEQEAYVTSELHGLHEAKPRVLWEVYCGGTRLSKVAQSIVFLCHWFGLQPARAPDPFFYNHFELRCPMNCSFLHSANCGARFKTSQPELKINRLIYNINDKNTTTPASSSWRWHTRNKLMVLDMLTLSNPRRHPAGKLWLFEIYLASTRSLTSACMAAAALTMTTTGGL